MDGLFSTLGMTPILFAFALAASLLGGVVKGAVGFGLPLVLVASLATFLPPDTALAMLLIPTVTSNVVQVLWQGVGASWVSVKMIRRFLIIGLVALVISAQLVGILPPKTLFLLIGLIIVILSMAQLMGWRIPLHKGRSIVEVILAILAGFSGGIAGVPGPPTVMYLTALDMPKEKSMQVQGMVYLLASVALMVAHIQSGVLRLAVVPMGMLMLIPAVLGMYIGGKLHNRMDQKRFRFLTLILLTIAGLNLIRRGVM